MNIPEDAYEAATRAEFNHWGPSWPTLTYETDVDHREYLRLQVERAVEAAAPHIAATALRDYADELEVADEQKGLRDFSRRTFEIRILRQRANRIQKGEV